jgi:hypothetical protein
MNLDLLRQWAADEQLVTDDRGHVGRVIGYKHGDLGGYPEAQVRILGVRPDRFGSASGPSDVVWLSLVHLRPLGMKPRAAEQARRAATAGEVTE